MDDTTVASDLGYTGDEMMTITAARQLGDGAVCFVGIGLPSEAANFALRTHAPNLVLVYESGTIGSRPEVLPLSIGDSELATSATSVVSVPEVFDYWLQAGRIDVGFLSAAQIDRYANLNTTVVGPYASPKVRLPGAGGAPEIAISAGEVLVVLRHHRRVFVEQVDFVTSVGFGRDGGGRPPGWGAGPTVVITDLGTLRPHPTTRELTLTSIHPGVTVEEVTANTQWNLTVDPDLEVTTPPSLEELAVLRDLRTRSHQSHHEARRLRSSVQKP
ncbi:CoA-transferase subunit beta [soil metagenome]